MVWIAGGAWIVWGRGSLGISGILFRENVLGGTELVYFDVWYRLNVLSGTELVPYGKWYRLNVLGGTECFQTAFCPAITFQVEQNGFRVTVCPV